MTTIHMETEKVRAVAKKLDIDASAMLSSLGQARSSASRLRFAWQGGDADDFNNEMHRLIKSIESQVVALQNLSVRVSREVDEWSTKDISDQTRVIHTIVSGSALLGGAALVGNSTSTSFLERPAHTPSWLEEHFTFNVDAGLEGSYLSRTGKGNWHHEDPKLGIEAKAGVGGAISESKHHSWGKWEVGAKAGVDKEGLDGGVYAEGSVFEAHDEGVIGSSLFGFTLTGAVAAGSGEAFAGIKDNQLGASIGGSVVSGEVGVGLNLFGYNISLSGGAGLGLQAGFKIGPKTEAKLGPFKIGISIGKAIANN